MPYDQCSRLRMKMQPAGVITETENPAGVRFQTKMSVAGLIGNNIILYKRAHSAENREILVDTETKGLNCESRLLV